MLEAFERIWGTKELLASFDGINHTLPLPEGKRLPSTPWPHMDQNPHLQGLQCAQGIINFAPNGPEDGGLVVLKGSQKLTETFFKTHSMEKKAKWGTVPDDWNGFDPEEVAWFKERGAEEIKVCVDPGDLIVWDSRTVHWNVLPQSDQTRSIVCTLPLHACSCDVNSLTMMQMLAIRRRHSPRQKSWRRRRRSS